MSEWLVILYETADGQAVVEEEIEAFGKREAPKVYRGIVRLKDFGTGLRGEYVRHVEGKLWELRVDRYRVLYFLHQGNAFVLLRAFMKKSQRTPRGEIATAARRMEDYLARTEKEEGNG